MTDTTPVTEHPILGRLARALGDLPPALRRAAEGEPVPLVIGVDEPLKRALVNRGMGEEEASRLVYNTLRNLTRGAAYRLAVADEGAWRHDLGGNRVERVSEGHALAASNLLLQKVMREANQLAKESPPKRNPGPRGGPAKPAVEVKAAPPPVVSSARPGKRLTRW